MTTSWLRKVAEVAVVLTMVAAAAAGGDAPKAAPAAPAALQVPGTVEAFEVVDMAAKVWGYVREVSVDIGDRVKAGQVLAVIDVPELHKELAQAKAEEASRAAALAFAEAGHAAARTKLEVARQQLVPFQAVAKLKEETLRRVTALYEGKAANAQDLDDIRSARDAAAADVAVANSKIAAADADLEVAKASVTLAEKQREVARAAIDRITTLIGYTQLVAPFDGVVTRRLVNRGVLVQAATSARGEALLTVQRTDLMRVFADVPEADISKVRPGVSAEVLPYGFSGQPFRGPVTRTASSLDPATRTLRTEIDLPNPDGRLMHGMYVQVRILPEATPTTAQAARGSP